MASYTVAEDAIGTAVFTMAANTVDTVTFADDLTNLGVINVDGVAEVFYTMDGSTPTVGGANCYYLPAAAAVDTRCPRTSGGTVVKLISAGTPKIRVQRG